MAISRLENTLKLWKEELRVFPEKTTLKPRDIKRLERAIDKWYDMEARAQRHVDKFEQWVKENDKG